MLWENIDTFFYISTDNKFFIFAFVAKFLFFDTAVCTSNSVWFVPGTDSSPRAAEGCSLGVTGKYAIAAGAVFFFCLIVVCLKAPTMRDLEPNYGLDVDRDDHEETSDDNNDTGSERDHYGAAGPHEASDFEGDESEFTITSKGYDSEYGSAVDYWVAGSTRDDDELLSQRINSLDDKYSKQSADVKTKDIEEYDDRYNPIKPPINTVTTKSGSCSNAINPTLVSESRLSAAERLAINASPNDTTKQDLIEKFVSELDASFAAEASSQKQ